MLLLLFLGFGYLLFKSGPVQTWLTSGIVSFLNYRYGVKTNIKSVDIDFFESAVLTGFYVEDDKGDTLLYVDRLSIDIGKLQEGLSNLNFGDLKMDKVCLYIKKYKDGEYNYTFLSKKFNKKNAEKKSRLAFSSSALNITGLHFTYNNFGAENTPEVGMVDFNNLDLRNTNLISENIKVFEDSITGAIESLVFEDVSGFKLKEMKMGKLFVGANKIAVTDVALQTNQSKINGDFGLQFNSFEDFSDFADNVRIKSEIRSSQIELADFVFFVKKLDGIKREIHLNEAHVRGSFNNLRIRSLALKTGRKTRFLGDVNLIGLPDLEETSISMTVRNLVTDKRDLENIPIAPFLKSGKLKVPKNIASLEEINFKGRFSGYYYDFVAFGKLKTALGELKADLNFSRDTVDSDYLYLGNLAINDFDLGQFYNNDKVGRISSNLWVKGKGLKLDNLNVLAEGLVDSLNYMDYTYKKLALNGSIEKYRFTGLLSCEDENLHFSFAGDMNFKPKVPEMNFKAKIVTAKLGKLNLVQGDTSFSLSTELEIDAAGIHLNNFKGNLASYQLNYVKNGKSYYIDDLKLKVTSDKNEKELLLNSSFCDASIKGQFDFKTLTNSFQATLSDVFPELITKERGLKANVPDQQLAFEFKIKDYDAISPFVPVELSLSKNTVLKGVYDNEKRNFSITGYSDSVLYKSFNFSGFKLAMNKKGEEFDASFTGYPVLKGNLTGTKVGLLSKGKNGRLISKFSWESATDPIEDSELNEVYVTTRVNGKDNFDINILPFNARLFNKEWCWDNPAKILIDSSSIDIAGLHVSGGTEVIDVFGKISHNKEDNLIVAFKHFALQNITGTYIDSTDFVFKGIIDGKLILSEIYDDFNFISDLNIAGLGINTTDIGNFRIFSSYDDVTEQVSINGGITREGKPSLSFAGTHTPSLDKENLDITAQLHSVDLKLLNLAIDEEDVLDIKGDASGNLNIRGEINRPKFTGELYLDDVVAFVPYLKTTYYLNGKAGIFEDMFTLDYLPLTDRLKGEGHLIGTFYHNNFYDFNYNLFAEVNKIQSLHTTAGDNTVYYGDAYATGSVEISGYEDLTEIDVDVKTEGGTKVNFPLTATQEVVEESFVSFKKDSIQEVKVDGDADILGLALNIDVETTSDAEFRIIFDERLGDQMTTSGSGNLLLKMSKEGRFEMFGAYEINQGDYFFTLKNVASKRFQLKKGSKIKWYGDPYNAELSLSALYKIRAYINDLIPSTNIAEGGGLNRRVPVEVEMKLSNYLLNPDIDFAINLPSVDPLTKEVVNSVLISQDDITEQAFALLLLRRFIPITGQKQTTTTDPSTDAANGGSDALEDASSVLISNQLSDLLSKISDDVDIGINYDRGKRDELNSQRELAVALSTRLFKERLSISGNFGVASENRTSNNVIGDFDIEYNITEDGRLKARVFNQTDNYQFFETNPSQFTQGVGVFYREEFNEVKEINWIKGIRQLFGKKKKVQIEQEQKKVQ